MKNGERRKAPRIVVRQLAQASGQDPQSGEHTEIMGTTRDISEGGVRFEGGGGFRQGSEVSISFSVGEAIIEAVGQVVHFTPVEDGGITVGIRFMNLSEQDRQFLETYCRGKADEQEG